MSGPRQKHPAPKDSAPRGRLSWVARYVRAHGGNVAAITALMIVPLVGLFGLAGEGSYWGLVHRAEQNAADQAAIAAGNTYQSCLNNGGGTSCGPTTYQPAGWAVTSKNGFTNGASDSSGNTSVTITGGVTCPTNVTVSNPYCIQVTVTKKVPMYLVKVVGYSGNTTFASGPYSGGRGQIISSTAIAGGVKTLFPVCVLALDSNSGDTGIRNNGGKDANLGNCTIFSDSKAICNGHNTGAIIGGAQYTNGGGAGCGITQYSNAGYVSDPYAYLASNIPSYTCSSNPGVTLAGGSYNATSLATALGGVTTTDGSGNTYIEVCGNLTISPGTTATLSSGNAIIVVNNGSIVYPTTKNIGTTELNTTGAAGMTLIFQGNSPTPFNDVNNGASGTLDYLDIAAPTSGTWSGVTIYDPVATTMTYYGNAPAWDLTGITYLPNAAVEWSGIIGKATSGYECFDLVTYSLYLNGTGNMFQPSGGNVITNPNLQCTQAGVTPPEANIGIRYVLVG